MQLFACSDNHLSFSPHIPCLGSGLPCYRRAHAQPPLRHKENIPVEQQQQHSVVKSSYIYEPSVRQPLERLTLPTQSNRCLHEISPNIWRSEETAVLPALSAAPAGCSWWADKMFEVHEECKGQTPGIAQPLANVQDWDCHCPSLVGGDDASPTTSLSTWTPGSPLHRFQDTRTISSPGLYGSGAKTLSYAPSNTPLSSEQQLCSVSSVGEIRCSDMDSMKYQPRFDGWQLSTNPGIAIATPDDSWSISGTPSLSTSFSSTEHSDMDMFPPFDSRIASEQMIALGYTLPSEMHEVRELEYLVPGLVSHSLMDDSVVKRAPSVESTIADQEINSNYGEEEQSYRGAEHAPFDDDDASSSPPPPAHSAKQCLLSQDMEDRNDRDLYLLQARRSGLSYKEIKRRGGFTEAESTLRGRIRMLSKPKHERVRRPQWHQFDLILLHRAVSAFSATAANNNPGVLVLTQRSQAGRHAASASKLPWKKISEWMRTNGASYPFAPATCAKRWAQIRGAL